MVMDLDDWGIDHDCRDRLRYLKSRNLKFKVDLFTVPAKTTLEMLEWAKNQDWIELCVHGWDHHDNNECKEWKDEDCFRVIDKLVIRQYFVPVFKAPGWQISDGCYVALKKRGFIVADQQYNEDRWLQGQRVYLIGKEDYHGHTWDCGCGNGIYEDWDNIISKIENATSFEFITERVQDTIHR